MHIKLVQDLGVDDVVAQHLSETYGDRAFEVGRNASMTGMRWPVVGKRLNPEYPYIEGEVSRSPLYNYGPFLLVEQSTNFVSNYNLTYSRFDTQSNENMQQRPLIFWQDGCEYLFSMYRRQKKPCPV